MFRVAAISENYKFKQSDFIEYVIDELVADMTKPRVRDSARIELFPYSTVHRELSSDNLYAEPQCLQ